MNKRATLLGLAALVAALVLALGAGYAFAQSGPGASGDQQFGPGHMGGQGMSGTTCPNRAYMVAGEVVRVEGEIITVKDASGQEKAVKVTDQTQYYKQGAAATLADVTPGITVHIRLTEPVTEGSELIAERVCINPGGNYGAGHQGTMGPGNHGRSSGGMMGAGHRGSSM